MKRTQDYTLQFKPKTQMAVEEKRGCGYRKVGGIYLVGGKSGVDCHRLPFALNICPCCGGGIKFTRGNTWIEPLKLFGDCDQLGSDHDCHKTSCYMCFPPKDKHILLWVGKSFYPTPGHFIRESNEHGISRRIGAIPRNFKLGESIIYLAHIEAYYNLEIVDTTSSKNGQMELSESELGQDNARWIYSPGIFTAFKPTSIEKIITQTMSENVEEMDKLKKQGITPVIVPDNDIDHMGSVHDKPEIEETN